eukprot:417173-Pelagomonas_calceolata.AAC.5
MVCAPHCSLIAVSEAAKSSWAVADPSVVRTWTWCREPPHCGGFLMIPRSIEIHNLHAGSSPSRERYSPSGRTFLGKSKSQATCGKVPWPVLHTGNTGITSLWAQNPSQETQGTRFYMHRNHHKGLSYSQKKAVMKDVLHICVEEGTCIWCDVTVVISCSHCETLCNLQATQTGEFHYCTIRPIDQCQQTIEEGAQTRGCTCIFTCGILVFDGGGSVPFPFKDLLDKFLADKGCVASL